MNVEPPKSEEELLRRARALAGHPLGAIAERLCLPWADTSRSKGFVGQLLERALGATATSRAEPDFVGLGIELKSVPVDAYGKPSETTFVCTADLTEMATRWEQSRVRKKLARVLFVPVEADRALAQPQRRVGMPFLWRPSAEEEGLLRGDYEEFAELVSAGRVEEITAHLGQVLQMRPKGRNARQVRWGVDEDGTPIRVPPRGFYLRAPFVGSLLQRAYAIA